VPAVRIDGALGTACGVSGDAGWGMLLGYSLRDMWTEAMIRDLCAALTTYARGVANGYHEPPSRAAAAAMHIVA